MVPSSNSTESPCGPTVATFPPLHEEEESLQNEKRPMRAGKERVASSVEHVVSAVQLTPRLTEDKRPTILPSFRPPRPSVIEITTSSHGGSGAIDLAQMTLLPELILASRNFKKHKDGKIEITNKQIVGELRRLSVSLSNTNFSCPAREKYWPKKTEDLSPDELRERERVTLLRMIVDRFHSQKRPYTRPSLQPVETTTPLSDDVMTQIPESIVNTGDLVWPTDPRRSLIIKRPTASRLMAARQLYIPVIGPFLSAGCPIDRWIPSTHNKPDNNADFNQFQRELVDITRNHIEQGGWFWLTCVVNGLPKLDFRLLESLMIARLLWSQDRFPLTRICRGYSLPLDNRAEFLESFVHQANAAAVDEENCYNLNLAPNYFASNIDIFSKENSKVLQNRLKQLILNEKSTEQSSHTAAVSKPKSRMRRIRARLFPRWRKKGKGVDKRASGASCIPPAFEFFELPLHQLHTPKFHSESFLVQGPEKRVFESCNGCFGNKNAPSSSKPPQHSRGCELEHIMLSEQALFLMQESTRVALEKGNKEKQIELGRQKHSERQEKGAKRKGREKQQAPGSEQTLKKSTSVPLKGDFTEPSLKYGLAREIPRVANSESQEKSVVIPVPFSMNNPSTSTLPLAFRSFRSPPVALASQKKDGCERIRSNVEDHNEQQHLAPPVSEEIEELVNATSKLADGEENSSKISESNKELHVDVSFLGPGFAPKAELGLPPTASSTSSEVQSEQQGTESPNLENVTGPPDQTSKPNKTKTNSPKKNNSPELVAADMKKTDTSNSRLSKVSKASTVFDVEWYREADPRISMATTVTNEPDQDIQLPLGNLSGPPAPPPTLKDLVQNRQEHKAVKRQARANCLQ